MNGEIAALLWDKKEQASRQGVYLEYEIENIFSYLPEGLQDMITILIDAAMEIANDAALEKWAYFRMNDTDGGLQLICGAACSVSLQIRGEENSLTKVHKLIAKFGESVETDFMEDSLQMTVYLDRPKQKANSL